MIEMKQGLLFTITICQISCCFTYL